MEISPKLLQGIHTQTPEPHFHLNDKQRAIIEHDEGPLLVIAGPGSGKTWSIILRAMNILLLGKAEPSQIVLCTFTEKAANEMQTRMMALAHNVGYTGDLSGLRVGTIHSICNQLILEYRHHTPLGNDYRLLEQFEQWLFIFRHFHKLGSSKSLEYFLYTKKWKNRWNAAKRLQEYFDKIIEELVDVERLLADGDEFQGYLAKAYVAYKELLKDENCLSFALQLAVAHKLLYSSPASREIIAGIRYVFVDEYQDTNYIQERIIRKLAFKTNNLCVVGDEDQALYRFRGATVRNMREFDKRSGGCRKIYLTTNYRTHEQIVQKYDRWMKSHNWTGTTSTPFRYDKTIEPDSSKSYENYPAVFSIHGRDIHEEAEKFADCIAFLKEQGIVTGYDHIALLLRSVKPSYSDPYTDILKKRGIPYSCPRARSFFERDEVRLLIACFAALLEYNGEKRNVSKLMKDESFPTYVRERCLPMVQDDNAATHSLLSVLEELRTELANLPIGTGDEEEQQATMSLMDCFYRLLVTEPFTCFVKDEQKKRNLVIFSSHLKSFQNLYRYTHLTEDTLSKARNDFFVFFLPLLSDAGVNEYEDAEQPVAPDHVQIMTIHQAKGLEFPVVIVGSLNEEDSSPQRIDSDLGKFYPRGRQSEPEDRIPGFDMMRLYYVAFSRAEQLLALTENSHKPHDNRFNALLKGLPQWPAVRDDLHVIKPPEPKVSLVRKPRYSFTADVQLYETCPRQYEYFREYNFVPARQREVFLGLLVHQTIEEIHHTAIEGKFFTLDDEEIERKLDRVYECLSKNYPYPIPPNTKEIALTQVLNYFWQNRREIQQVKKTEVGISLTKDDYIFTGRIDLLMEKNGEYEIMDFKTEYKAQANSERLENYKRQLYSYASAFEQHYQKPPAKLLLYWTAEPRREEAIMEIPYRADDAERYNRSFDEIARKINIRDFQIATLPERHTCERCDLQHLCMSEGIISAPICV